VRGKAQARGVMPGHQIRECPRIPRDRPDHQLGIGHRLMIPPDAA